tara:strand:+ start:1890 stop:2582 length:693 start_codon:yes stop_codon:yes gene_type:complete
MQSTSILRALGIGALSLALAGCTTNQPDATTYDGLVLDKSVSHADVYKKPGATLAGYSAYGLMPCQVAFKKNWLRDQNRNRIDLSRRVTQKDVDRIKDTLSSECDARFREALEQAPAYPLVEEFSEGEAVLILHPSIINLDINAPDTMSSGMSRSYTTSAGEMTLVLEAIDGTTHETLFRVVDRKRDMDSGRLQWTNSVTNRAEAERALNRWASLLRKALDSATASGSES